MFLQYLSKPPIITIIKNSEEAADHRCFPAQENGLGGFRFQDEPLRLGSAVMMTDAGLDAALM